MVKKSLNHSIVTRLGLKYLSMLERRALKIINLLKSLCQCIFMRSIIEKLPNSEYEYITSSSPVQSIGKKTALNEHQEANLMDVIKQHYLDYSPLRKYEILELAQKISNKSLSDSWVDSFIKRNEDFLCTKDALPIDDLRTEVSIENIVYYVCALMDCSLGVDPSLFITIDEMGYTDVSTSHPYSAVIPREFESNQCHFKIDRNQKNFTTITSITLDGDILTPCIVIPSGSIPTELDLSGFRDGKDAVVLTSDSSYANNEVLSSIS